MIDKNDYIDFGAPKEFGSHVFVVHIPASRNQAVTIEESYGYSGGDSGVPNKELRVILERSNWSQIAETTRRVFNHRLKQKKLLTSRWKTGDNKVDRLLGRELTVLAWAAERQPHDLLPVICTRWEALRPEERWWLFGMTVAEAGLPQDYERGWRKALRFSLSDPIKGNKPIKRPRPIEADLFTLPFIEEE
jgi:hypothetical protein